MPRKTVQKPTEKPVQKKQTPAPQPAAVQAAPKKARKEPVAVVEDETVADESTSTKVVRHVPTRETVEQEFNELVASIDEEINKLRESSTKSKGVKFLRTVNKRIKTLRAHALRVSKQKQTVRRNNNNSGFLKPVSISKELANFTGWGENEMKSRVDVTKYICNYIREHNLQDETDKRKIRVEDDPKLKKLLKFDGKDKKPLTYYSLQTYLKSHFPATEKSS